MVHRATGLWIQRSRQLFDWLVFNEGTGCIEMTVCTNVECGHPHWAQVPTPSPCPNLSDLSFCRHVNGRFHSTGGSREFECGDE